GEPIVDFAIDTPNDDHRRRNVPASHCGRPADEPLCTTPDGAYRRKRCLQVSTPRRAHKLPGECDMGCDESVVRRRHPAGRLPLALVDLVGGGYHWSHCLYTPRVDRVGGSTERRVTTRAC